MRLRSAGRTLGPVAASLLCGAALALGYPRFSLALAAWIAPLPWLLLTVSSSPARAFRLGCAFGLGFFGLLLVWVHGVLSHYTTLPLVLSVPIWVLLVGYLALYPGVFAAMLAGLVHRLGAPAILIAPVLWVGLESARGFLLGGFPWGFAGSSHAGGLALWQAASLGGVCFVSLLVAAAWSALTLLALAVREHSRKDSAPLVPRAVGTTGAGGDRTGRRVRSVSAPVMLAAVGLLMAVLLAEVWGAARLEAYPPVLHTDHSQKDLIQARPPEEPPVSTFGIALVQGGFGSDLDEEQARRALDDYLDLSRKAAPTSPAVIVWPESNAPFLIEGSPDFLSALVGLGRHSQARILLGSVAEEGAQGLRNSAYLIGPAGVEHRYDKRRLVQYGEYVPLKSVFPFIRKFVPEAGDFAPGSEIGIMSVEGRLLGVSICYEMIFPGEILLQARAGAQVLVNLTNDSWFPGSGPWQHSEFAQMRAIETGLWTARAASTGRTVLIDPQGRVTAALPMGAPGVLSARVPGSDLASYGPKTLYVGFGAWVGRACVTITALVLAFLVVGNIIDRRRRVPISRPRGKTPA